jgi:hypothetical protein
VCLSVSVCVQSSQCGGMSPVAHVPPSPRPRCCQGKCVSLALVGTSTKMKQTCSRLDSLVQSHLGNHAAWAW